MKRIGRINAEGVLEIERAGAMTQQKCLTVGRSPCSDSCPLFREPSEEHGVTALALCGGVIWFFDEFTDERGGMNSE